MSKKLGVIIEVIHSQKERFVTFLETHPAIPRKKFLEKAVSLI